MKLTDLKDQEHNRSTVRRRAPVVWPWLIVVAAWTLALLAVLTNQTFLINHRYLLVESHLPWLVALVIFLACWQVMTVGMMLPSSMPMVYMMVHASRQQRHPRTIQLVFLAGYAVTWTGFANERAASQCDSLLGCHAHSTLVYNCAKIRVIISGLSPRRWNSCVCLHWKALLRASYFETKITTTPLRAFVPMTMGGCSATT